MKITSNLFYLLSNKCVGVSSSNSTVVNMNKCDGGKANQTWYFNTLNIEQVVPLTTTTTITTTATITITLLLLRLLQLLYY